MAKKKKDKLKDLEKAIQKKKKVTITIGPPAERIPTFPKADLISNTFFKKEEKPRQPRFLS